MSALRLLSVVATAACGILGALVAVGVARTARPDQVPVDELAIALTVCAYAGVGLLIAAAQPRHRVGRLMLIGVAVWGIGEGLLAVGLLGYLHVPGSVTGAEWHAVAGTAMRAAGWLVLVLAVPLFFPDGRLPWQGRRAPVVVVVATVVLFTVSTLLAPTPPGFPAHRNGQPDRTALVDEALRRSARPQRPRGLRPRPGRVDREPGPPLAFG
ncbi:hypothetical protein [Microbacterium sp. SD291]|uniref:hypothetical protein n=1 Tax=Microbacterium sp. SD291 TaxID=2782007 RepID=UPI001A970123|nr:hypothetical protein [Microbacterium sp. SD291]MBO0979170.1 hypothetical protein [Microbacterium sp. SD291]